MTISIFRKKNTYQFTHNGEKLFIGTQNFKFFQRVKYLHKDDKIICDIRFKFRLPFKLVYNINYHDPNNNLKFIKLEYKNFFAMSYTCKIDNDSYEIIPHKGVKTSIFKNNIQIGYFDQKKVEFMGGQNMLLILDDDAEISLICSLIFSLYCNFGDDDSTASYDLGNVGPEKKVFDYRWKPNSKKTNL